MALDYLPIQASSVPCERVFSSSAETDTSRRNQLSPVLMEALQMLKFSINNENMDFTSDLLTPETDLYEDTTDDLLTRLGGDFTTVDAREDLIDQVIKEVV